MVGVNFNNITYPFRRFFRKIKNVFRWLPTIWKDEDFDNHFIVEILIKKLEHTRDFFLSDRTHITEAKKVAEEIQEAKENSFVPVSLGDKRLRTETAGVAAVVLLNN